MVVYQMKEIPQLILHDETNLSFSWKQSCQQTQHIQQTSYQYNTYDTIDETFSFIPLSYITDLENEIGLSFSSVIFDSNINNYSQSDYIWNRKQSYQNQFDTFSSLIMYQSQICFIVQTNNDIIFGCYIDAEITNTCTFHHGKIYGQIFDSNAFLFTFINRELEIAPIKQNNPIAFSVNSDTSPYLCAFGNGDVIFGKEEYDSDCSQTRKTTFQYPRKNFLIGETGKDCFSIKRFIVVQMEE